MPTASPAKLLVKLMRRKTAADARKWWCDGAETRVFVRPNGCAWMGYDTQGMGRGCYSKLYIVSVKEVNEKEFLFITPTDADTTA